MHISGSSFSTSDATHYSMSTHGRHVFVCTDNLLFMIVVYICIYICIYTYIKYVRVAKFLLVKLESTVKQTLVNQEGCYDPPDLFPWPDCPASRPLANSTKGSQPRLLHFGRRKQKKVPFLFLSAASVSRRGAVAESLSTRKRRTESNDSGISGWMVQDDPSTNKPLSTGEAG